MRIGLITNMMDGQNAGIGRYTENLVKNLLLIDKKNEYYLIHTHKRKYNFKGNYCEIRLPFFDSIPKKLITGTFLFEKICRDYKLDVLHDLGQISPFFFKSKTKKILTIFDLSPILFPQFFTKLTNIYTKLFPVIIKNTDHVVTISENSKGDIVKIFKIPNEKISVTYLGIENKFRLMKNKINLETIRKKYNLPKRFILFVGTIEPRKNLSSLLCAFSSIRKNNKEVKLVIVGKMGWLQNNILKMVNRLKIKNDVIFTGFVEDKYLPYFYNLTELFVYPSLYEGFGFPILEAMACGCPVITSKVSSLPEIAGDAAILINPKKEHELISAICNVIIDNNLRSELSIRGLMRAKKFNWENCARETLKVYQSLI